MRLQVSVKYSSLPVDVDVCVCMAVYEWRIFEAICISETKGDRPNGFFHIGSLHESAQGESNGHITDGVTSLDDVIMVTS